MSFITYYECAGGCNVLGKDIAGYYCGLIQFLTYALAIIGVFTVFYLIYKMIPISGATKNG